MLAFSLSDVGNNTAVVVLAVDPGKSLGKMIPFPERRVLAVKGTEVSEKSLETLPYRVGL
jgi:hypothetical protein